MRPSLNHSEGCDGCLLAAKAALPSSPPLPAPPSALLSDITRLTIEDSPNRGITWEKAHALAAAEGAHVRLPTRDELVVAAVAAGVLAVHSHVDIWMPVRRADGVRGDWVCLHPDEQYRSHLSHHKQIPGWGSDGGGHKHIPGTHGHQLSFFLVIREDAEVSHSLPCDAK